MSGQPVSKKKSISIIRLIDRFIQMQSSSSIVLAVCTLIAIVAANGPIALSYFHLLEIKFAGLSIHHWINDGLMAIFFFVVGMEIKREIVEGELSTFRKATLPVAAAFGGMLVPALIYFTLNPTGTMFRGWAIPMATDIAFALGVLLLLGKRIPLSLKIFLLALAIVDDLGAVLIIATFYTEEIRGIGLLIASAGILAILAARWLKIKSYFLYIPLGVLLWVGVLYSGIHATIAGVLLGLLTPHRFPSSKRGGKTYSPLEDLIHKLNPYVSYGIMPIFAIANAGIPLSGISLTTVTESTVTKGVGLGLLIGKPVGIMLLSGLTVALGLARLPADLKWRHLFGVACLAGIGFTMAIFITNLSLPEAHAVEAKVAILGASAIAAALGYVLLLLTLDRK